MCIRDRYERINQRVDQMMEEGLFEEINELVTTHENVWQLQSFQGIGYKEWKAYFEKQCPKEACIEQIKKNSRNFAKRQYTWSVSYTHLDVYKRQTLWSFLDKCRSSMGSRLLKKWIEYPLVDTKMINKRLDAIEYLNDNFITKDELKEHLSFVYDMELSLIHIL